MSIGVALTVSLAFAQAWAPPPSGVEVGGAESGGFVDGDLFSGFGVESATLDVSRAYPEFSLDRLSVGGGAQYARLVSLYAQAETIRSAAPLSAFGIDKDSLLPRVRLGYGQVAPRFSVLEVPLTVSGRLGLVPELWLEWLEGRTGARGIAKLPSERAGLLVPSDLGASVSLDVGGVVRVGVSIANGEGLNEVERNAGKDIEAVLSVAYGVFDIANSPVRVGAQAMVRDGSIGVAPVRNNRAGAAVFVNHAFCDVALEGMLGVGHEARANRMPLSLGARTNIAVLPSWLGIAATYDALLADVALPADEATRHAASLGVFTEFGIPAHGLATPRVLQRMRVYALVDGSWGAPIAGPVPGSPAASTLYGARAVIEVILGTPVLDPFASTLSKSR